MSDMAVDFEPHKFNVEEFFRMGEADVFGDRHIELLDGMLVEVSPFGAPHTIVAGGIHQYLSALLERRASVYESLTLRLDEYNAPEPDIAILLPRESNDFERPFVSAEVQALIEV